MGFLMNSNLFYNFLPVLREKKKNFYDDFSSYKNVHPLFAKASYSVAYYLIAMVEY